MSLPEYVRAIIARYKENAKPVENWLGSIDHGAWIREDRDANTRELLHSSAHVKASGAVPPVDIINSAEIVRQERNWVDQWYRSQISCGYDVEGARVDEHEAFTRTWRTVVENIASNAPAQPRCYADGQTSSVENVDCNSYIGLHKAGLLNSALAAAQTELKTGLDETWIIRDDLLSAVPRPRQFSNIIRHASNDYHSALCLAQTNWQAWEATPIHRLKLAWMSTLTTHYVAENAWKKACRGRSLDECLSQAINIEIEQLLIPVAADIDHIYEYLWSQQARGKVPDLTFVATHVARATQHIENLLTCLTPATSCMIRSVLQRITN